MHIEHIESDSDDTATILIEGLERDLRLLHVTDITANRCARTPRACARSGSR